MSLSWLSAVTVVIGLQLMICSTSMQRFMKLRVANFARLSFRVRMVLQIFTIDSTVPFLCGAFGVLKKNVIHSSVSGSCIASKFIPLYSASIRFYFLKNYFRKIFRQKIVFWMFFWKSFVRNFFKKFFLENFFRKNVFLIFLKKFFFRKFNLQKLIHVSLDKIDSFFQLHYLVSLRSDFITLDFWSAILMSTII